MRSPRLAGCLAAGIAAFSGLGAALEATADYPPPNCSRGTSDPLRRHGQPVSSTSSAPAGGCVAAFSDVRPPRSANAPQDAYLCPLASQFRALDPRFPPSAVFVSYQPPQPGSSGNGDFIADLVTRIRALSPGTRINVLASKGSPPRAGGVRVIETDVPVSLWAQDTHQFGVIDGKPAMLDLPTERERGNALPRAIADACAGSRLEYVPEPCRDPEVGFDSGGNIEALPGGGLMIGSGAHRGVREFLRDQNRGREPIVVRSEFLAVGHVDEMFSIVPTSGPAPCNFALAFISPALGLRTLEGQPKSEQVGHRDVEPDGPQAAGELRTHLDLVAANLLIGRLVEQDRERLLVSMQTSEGRPSSGCAKVSTLEVPALFRSSLWRRSEIAAQVPPTLGLVEMKKRINDLSGADLDAAIGTLSGTAGGDFESVLPNMVNGISIGATTLTPSPRYSPFQAAMESNMRAAGVRPQFMQDTLYHNGMGGIHSGTNIVRACSELMESSSPGNH